MLRSGREHDDRRLRSCFEHALTPEHAGALMSALRQAAAMAMRSRSWRSAKLDGPKFCSYPAGGFFRAHRDRSADARDPAYVRTPALSLVCVLNDGDPSGGLPTFDGGALVLYLPQRDGSVAPVNLTPSAGSIVAFSAELLHEVRPV